ncbi:porin [Variovorax rhizosphaerae]|uniref:Porin n=1 Tax=Variovorax rhizosphaerae TaxID=1836200 RepID=A0ABU8WLB1_9BURK
MRIRIHIAMGAMALASMANLSSAQSLAAFGPSGDYLRFSGLLDLGVGRVINKSAAGVKATVSELHQAGSGGSVLDWVGRENLGGGMYTGFLLETSIQTDTGGIGSLPTGPYFNRTSAVYLGNNWGELALGQVRTPTYSNIVFHDPMFNNGYNGSMKLISPLGTRVNSLYQNINSINYFLPPGAGGGFYGHVQATFPEGQPNQKYFGWNFGYAKGPMDIGVARGTTETTPGNPDYVMTNVGGSYDFGILKLIGFYVNSKYGDASQNVYLAGVTFPIGVNQIKLSYSRGRYSGGALGGASANAAGVQVIHFLSKRVGIYGNFARVNNSGKAAFRLPTPQNTASTLGGSSTGFDAGLRLAF